MNTHPFEEETNDAKSWNNLLELSKNLINTAVKHLSRSPKEQLQQNQKNAIVHLNDRWECLQDSCSVDVESATFEDDVESDDTLNDDSEDEVGD